MEAGVSTATVSRVLNNHPRVSEAAREKVLSVANENRYVHSVGKKSTTNIALVYTGESSLGESFDSLLMWGMSKGLENFGYDLMILDAKRSLMPGETYSQMFLRKGVRGVVLRTTLATRSVCVSIAEQGVPAVVVGDRFDDPRLKFFYADSREPSREAVEHLISLGHRKIGIALNVIDDSDHADRLAGYKAALVDNGLEADRKLVLRCPANRQGGMQLMRRVAAMADRPTALFITDPATAAGLMKESRNVGISIPDDLSIVGFDDGEMRFDMCPEMSAVCQDTPEIGREALEALHEIIQQSGSIDPGPTTLRAWLEVHRSTAAPPPSI
jgi:DNA-binding LacI/PurR family transcriptional regulator